MANVNAIVKEIKDNQLLSRSWRAASSGASYAPVENELWRINPSEPFGSPLGGQTAVRGIVSDQDRPFWPSWLIKQFPLPKSAGNTQVVLRGHTLDGKPVAEIPLEDLLQVLSSKDIRVASLEAVIGLKRTYKDGQFTGLREEVVSIYHWETVERDTKAK